MVKIDRDGKEGKKALDMGNCSNNESELELS